MKNLQGHQVDNVVCLQGFQHTVATPQPKPKTIAEIPARKAHQGKPGGLLSAHPVPATVVAVTFLLVAGKSFRT
jgi:hypothetical protein